MGLGSREAQAKGTSTAQTGSHKISRRTGHRADRWCVRTVPSREVSEWTPGGGKEGRWRRRSRRATPARIPPPKGPGREESAFSRRSARRATSRAHSLRLARFPRRWRGIAPSLPILFSRSCEKRAIAVSCLAASGWTPGPRETGRRRRRRRSSSRRRGRNERGSAQEEGEEGTNERQMPSHQGW